MNGTLGLIGSGVVGKALARLAVDTGWNVVLSNSRGPHTLTGLVSTLGERARAATPTEAAQAGDLVVAAIPLHAYDQLPRTHLDGKTVIDAMNYDPKRDGAFAQLDSDELTSSELVQAHLPQSHVVKMFNNITDTHLLALARPSGAPDRSALPLTGNDANAKVQAADLLDYLGFDAVDLGALADSWRFGPNTPLYALSYAGEPPAGLGGPQELYRWFLQAPAVPLPAGQVRQLAATTVRGPAGLVL
ncbi:NADPH-dependent F420 reductase [Streptomyces sp. NPDC056663]|uniref:NADPH-dependent F420 reductase n=1 Tax=Streptomyces sp. NPDC056663 TaxID=3345899 RepID=UPI00368111D1